MNVDAGLLAYQKFQSIASCALGSLMGVLIAVPLTTSSSSPLMQIVMLLSLGAAGAGVGYRRRKSRAFLYFSLVGVLLLAGLVSESFEVTNAPGQGTP